MLDHTRRHFMSLVGGVAATWPVAAWAQRPEQLRRIAVFMDLAEGDPEGQARVAALKRGLQDLGWIDGHELADRVPMGRGRSSAYEAIGRGTCKPCARSDCE